MRARLSKLIYRLEQVEDLNGNFMRFTRTPQGVLTAIERHDGLRLIFANDARGRRTAITLIGIDGSQLPLARYAYDALGRMVAAECAHGMSVRHEWHATRPLLLRWHNKTGRTQTTFTYDDEGRVLHTQTNGLWNNDRFRYDPVARRTTYVPEGDERQAQLFAYDVHDNVTEEIEALGGVTRHAYNRVGFRTSTSDANGHAN